MLSKIKQLIYRVNLNKKKTVIKLIPVNNLIQDNNLCLIWIQEPLLSKARNLNMGMNLKEIIIFLGISRKSHNNKKLHHKL